MNIRRIKHHTHQETLCAAVGSVRRAARLTMELNGERQPGVMWLHNLYTKERFRRQGLASRLILEAERIAATEGMRLIRLLAWREDRRVNLFYRNRGFSIDPDCNPLDAEDDATFVQYCKPVFAATVVPHA